jgi:hypothetical protein
VTPCARGCCWTPLACARQRACLCHVEDLKPPPKGSDSKRYSDPTATQAIRNIMKGNPR